MKALFKTKQFRYLFGAFLSVTTILLFVISDGPFRKYNRNNFWPFGPRADIDDFDISEFVILNLMFLLIYFLIWRNREYFLRLTSDSRFRIIFKLMMTLLFLVALGKREYSYFLMMRIVASIGFGWIAYKAYLNNNILTTVIYSILLVIYQPAFKLDFDRGEWITVDVFTVLIFLITELKYFNSPSHNGTKVDNQNVTN